MFVISLFVPPKIDQAGTESTREKYGTLLNSFHPEDFNNKIGKNEVSVQFNHTHTYVRYSY